MNPRAKANRGIRPLYIGLFVHSTLPRGGVIHAIEVACALAARGHRVDLCAPDPEKQGLFRSVDQIDGVRFMAVEAARTPSDLRAHVAQRLDEWRTHFAQSAHLPRYDRWHAQDSISANALADLTERGAIEGYYRTVHHLDTFADPVLAAWQTRGFAAAHRVLCVSAQWQSTLREIYGIDSARVDNGVDMQRYTPPNPFARTADHSIERGDSAPIVLSVGGIEARKNTVTALAAFRELKTIHPRAQWWIAGGASLLDHSDYRRRFFNDAAAAGLTLAAADQTTCDADIRLLGTMKDADMPALYRAADVLLFPSRCEGFGLAVVEALACGTPVVTSRVAPFTEYLRDEVAWSFPDDPASITAALLDALTPNPRRRAAGFAVCRRFSWRRSAQMHETAYATAATAATAAAIDNAATVPFRESFHA